MDLQEEIKNKLESIKETCDSAIKYLNEDEITKYNGLMSDLTFISKQVGWIKTSATVDFHRVK